MSKLIIPISKLPKISVWTFTITVFITYGLSIYYGHTPFITTFSQTGNFPPESYIFTFGLNVSAFLLGISHLFYYFVFTNKYKIYEKGEFVSILTDASFGFAFLAIIGYFGLSIISYQTDKVWHGAFTIIMFLGNLFHSILVCVLQVKIQQGKNIKTKIMLSMSSLFLIIILFFHHYYEIFISNIWIEISRVGIETLAIYSLFFFLLCYENDLEDVEIKIILRNNKN